MSQVAGNGGDGRGSGVVLDLQEAGKGGNGAQGKVIIQWIYSMSSGT